MPKSKITAKQINELLRSMETSDERQKFIIECLDGICRDCFDVVDDRTCYCMADD